MRARRCFAVVTGFVAMLTGGLASIAQPAQAAGAIYSCFSYGGQRYQNLSTFLEYLGTDGRWYAAEGTASYTRANGCITYHFTPSWQQYMFRVHAVALVPQWRGVFNGISPHYGPSGSQQYDVGEARLAFYTLPSNYQDPPVSRTLTDDWLDDMTSSTYTSTCSSSSAASVACYMDSHNLVGNVVVPYRDFDGDGVIDIKDNFPNDSRYN